MANYLHEIITVKRLEVERLYDQLNQTPNHPFRKRLEQGSITKNPNRLRKNLMENPFSLIAEVKRRSPSAGEIADVPAPEILAEKYAKSGVAAISVLTDSFFGGSLADLERVADAKGIKGRIPVLRKDFMIDPIQLLEASLAGASVILLIVAVLGPELKQMLLNAKNLGLESIVEVHDERELQIALDAGAEIIGVNNRNLSTFAIDLHTSELLSPLIPKSIFKIAESGIRTPEEAQRMRDAGYHAILVGEALVKAKDPNKLIAELLGRL